MLPWLSKRSFGLFSFTHDEARPIILILVDTLDLGSYNHWTLLRKSFRIIFICLTSNEAVNMTIQYNRPQWVTESWSYSESIQPGIQFWFKLGQIMFLQRLCQFDRFYDIVESDNIYNEIITIAMIATNTMRQFIGVHCQCNAFSSNDKTVI